MRNLLLSCLPEEKSEAEITAARIRYLEDLAQSVFAKAQSILNHAGVPAGAVKTHFVSTISGEGVIGNLLEAAQTNSCWRPTVWWSMWPHPPRTGWPMLTEGLPFLFLL
jgi:hypothetical protein